MVERGGYHTWRRREGENTSETPENRVRATPDRYFRHAFWAETEAVATTPLRRREAGFFEKCVSPIIPKLNGDRG